MVSNRESAYPGRHSAQLGDLRVEDAGIDTVLRHVVRQATCRSDEHVIAHLCGLGHHRAEACAGEDEHLWGEQVYGMRETLFEHVDCPSAPEMGLSLFRTYRTSEWHLGEMRIYLSPAEPRGGYFQPRIIVHQSCVVAA